MVVSNVVGNIVFVGNKVTGGTIASVGNVVPVGNVVTLGIVVSMASDVSGGSVVVVAGPVEPGIELEDVTVLPQTDSAKT